MDKKNTVTIRLTDEQFGWRQVLYTTEHNLQTRKACLPVCSLRVSCSLPVTLSPNIGTLRFVGATCLILSYIFLTLRLYVQEWVLLLIQNKAALITRVLLNHLNYCMRLNSVANKKAYFTGEEVTFKYTDVSDLATQENMIFLV